MILGLLSLLFATNYAKHERNILNQNLELNFINAITISKIACPTEKNVIWGSELVGFCQAIEQNVFEAFIPAWMASPLCTDFTIREMMSFRSYGDKKISKETMSMLFYSEQNGGRFDESFLLTLIVFKNVGTLIHLLSNPNVPLRMIEIAKGIEDKPAELKSFLRNLKSSEPVAPQLSHSQWEDIQHPQRTAETTSTKDEAKCCQIQK